MNIARQCSYRDLKNQVLDVYYEFCRDEIGSGTSSNMQVLARVNDHFEGTFNHPVEELMFCVIELILSGVWNENVEKNCRAWIEAWKVSNDLDKIIAETSTKEMDLFLHDVRILKLF